MSSLTTWLRAPMTKLRHANETLLAEIELVREENRRLYLLVRALRDVNASLDARLLEQDAEVPS